MNDVIKSLQSEVSATLMAALQHSDDELIYKCDGSSYIRRGRVESRINEIIEEHLRPLALIRSESEGAEGPHYRLVGGESERSNDDESTVTDGSTADTAQSDISGIGGKNRSVSDAPASASDGERSELNASNIEKADTSR